MLTTSEIQTLYEPCGIENLTIMCSQNRASGSERILNLMQVVLYAIDQDDRVRDDELFHFTPALVGHFGVKVSDLFEGRFEGGVFKKRRNGESE